MNALPPTSNPMDEASKHFFLMNQKPRRSKRTVRRAYEIRRDQDKTIKKMSMNSGTPQYEIIQRIIDTYFESLKGPGDEEAK